MKKVFAKTKEAYGRVDVVVKCAGVIPISPIAPEQLAELYDINVLGTQRVNRAALTVLRSKAKALWCE